MGLGQLFRYLGTYPSFRLLDAGKDSKVRGIQALVSIVVLRLPLYALSVSMVTLTPPVSVHAGVLAAI